VVLISDSARTSVTSRVEQIVFVILLDDVELRWIGERTEVDSDGIDGRGDAFEAQGERAGAELDLANVAHEGGVGVVDGEREVGAVFVSGGRIGSGLGSGFLV
jgi:hypothetical protein